MKHQYLIVIFILALFWAGPADMSGQTAGVNETAQELYQLGLSALEKKQYDKARDLFLKAISYDKNFAELHAKLAETHILLKDEELGYESYKKYLQIVNTAENPSEDQLKLAEDIKKKIKKFQNIEAKISALSEDFVQKIMAIGQLALKTPDYQLAEEIFSMVQRLAMNNTEAAENLQKAKEEFTRGINEGKVAEEKDLATACYQEGLDLFKKAKYAEAAENFRKAMLYQTNFAEAVFGLGECSAKLNDPIKTVVNYRYCLNILKSVSQRSKEQNDLLARTAKALDKIDTQGKEFQKAKTEHVAKLSALVSEFMYKKYQRFAYKTIQRILVIDPAHKAANEALSKIDKRVTESKENDSDSKKLNLIAKGPPRKLFNGTDLNGWKSDNPMEHWNIQGGCLIGDPSPIPSKYRYKTPWVYWTYLLRKEPPPPNFIVTLKFSLIGERLNPDCGKPEIGVIYAEGGGVDLNWSSLSFRAMALEENTLEFICQNDRTILFVNNDLLTDTTRNGKVPAVGIYIKNFKYSISTFTIQEIQ